MATLSTVVEELPWRGRLSDTRAEWDGLRGGWRYARPEEAAIDEFIMKVTFRSE
jgi:hypothetical protein